MYSRELIRGLQLVEFSLELQGELLMSSRKPL